MSENVNIEEKHWFSNKQFIFILVFAIGTTWSVNEVVNRFELDEERQQWKNDLQVEKDKRQDNRIEYIDERIERVVNNAVDRLHSTSGQKKEEKP